MTAPASRNQLQLLNLADQYARIPDHWAPRVLTECNDHQVKLAKVQGEFLWHSHDSIDELFYVVAGELTLEFRDRTVTLRTGEMLVVPRGVEHKPSAAQECQLLLLEPRGVTNTGTAGGPRTQPNDVWL